MSGHGEALARRVARALFAPGRAVPGDRVLVALSGGLDSVALLHVVRFATELSELELVAAHFDHRMRPESAEDACWVQELARAWQVPLESGVASSPLASEAAARVARYAWLHEARSRAAARWILTAHHADDQAETVLFRIARGTGLSGLRGIPARRGALLRPLLGIWREEIEAYTHAHGLEHRDDQTNADGRFARNVLRREVIPTLSRVAPGARQALVRLSRVAAREERAWRTLLPGFLRAVVLERGDERIVLSRDVCLAWPEAVQARVLRHLARGLGSGLEEAGTLALIAFTRSGASGRSVSLPGRVVLAREFDRLVLTREGHARDERPLDIPAPEREPFYGEGEAEVGGRHLVARWSAGGLPAEDDALGSLGDEVVALPLARLAFPLRLRGRRPGDRIRFPYGSKKLKKLLGEARIPVSLRAQVPVLVDAHDRVVWVPGVARDVGMETVPGEEILQIGITDGVGA